MLDILGGFFDAAEDFLSHYGVGHLNGGHSGRYPWGSGEDAYQRYSGVLDEYDKYVSEGMKKADIATTMGCLDKWGKPSIKLLDARIRNAKAEQRMNLVIRARQLQDQGMGASEIGRIMGKSESSIRSLLDEGSAMRTSRCMESAKTLKEFVDKNRYVDIGAGAEQALGLTQSSFKTTVALLVDQGYQEQSILMENLGTNHRTTMTVLTPPDVSYGEVSEHRFDIVSLGDPNISKTMDIDGTVGKLGLKSIENVDSSRIGVVYNEEGGKAKDGLIEIRPGVPDIALGASDYAQVRIPVDNTHYIKGMAIYNPNLPPGVDILVNSNKHVGAPLKGYDDNSVLKVMKGIDKKTQTGVPDKDNPFGASVNQLEYVGADGKKHLSSVYVVHEEGEWQQWSKNLASQFLSKQPVPLAHRQLTMDYEDKKLQFEEICNLTNPTIKKKLLISFADDCDGSAVDLKAAPFPGQQYHVLIPDPRLKDNEIYAPNYADGTKVVCVRYPFAGNFEAAECTVRNTGSPSAELIGRNAPDAVCINSKVAAKMSGADFDGDAVVVFPLSDRVKVKVRDTLKGLKDFDTQEDYPGYPGMKVMSAKNKQTEMGKITNLIMDMTLKGASDEELERAVKHSMVIIDSEKHELNYKKSEKDNNIAELKKRWQGKDAENDETEDGSGGAGTIITRAKGQYRVDARKDWSPSDKTIDPVTGEKIYEKLIDKNKSNATYDEVKLAGTLLKDGSRVKVRKTKDGELYFNEESSSGKKTRVMLSENDLAESLDSTKGRVQINKAKDGSMYYLRKDENTGKTIRQPVTEADFAEPPRTVVRQEKSTRMAEESDPYKLTSGGSREHPGYPMEREYAEYASNMKALANAARKEWLATENLKTNPQAKAEYAEEIKSLDIKLRTAEANAPLERQAQRNANRTIALKKEANPDISKEDLKKYKQQAINAERERVGAKKKNRLIQITDREWEAIQKGAISHTKLSRIIENTDLDKLKKRATPHESRRTISNTMKSLAKTLANGGYTNQQIADRLGISPSSVYAILSGKIDKQS